MFVAVILRIVPYIAHHSNRRVLETGETALAMLPPERSPD